jgi:hypothetical protein
MLKEELKLGRIEGLAPSVKALPRQRVHLLPHESLSNLACTNYASSMEPTTVAVSDASEHNHLRLITFANPLADELR